VLILALAVPVAAEQLAVPARPADALGGTAFVSVITPLSLADREEAILQQVAIGNLPDFVRNLVPVTVTRTAGGAPHTITCHVLPDYLAIGSDSDYFLAPMTPLVAQRIADLVACTLPTRRMVDDIWDEAEVQLDPQPIAWDPSNVTVGLRPARRHGVAAAEPTSPPTRSATSSAATRGRRHPPSCSRTLGGGICSWHQSSSTPISRCPGPRRHLRHYSHGIRLVALTASLDRALTTVPEVLADPVLWSFSATRGRSRYPATTSSRSRCAAWQSAVSALAALA
jgi:hypothetical protein